MPKIYLGPDAAQASTHRMHICPGNDKSVVGAGEMPSEWTYDDGVNAPTFSSFTVEFHYGVADVPQHLYRYMLAAKLARATRLLVPEQDGLLTAGVKRAY